MCDYLDKRKELDAQFTELAPVIEQERCVYIHAEYGRVQAIIGTGYWNKETGQAQIFHGTLGDDLALIEARPKDPFDVTIEELYWITTQYKHIERCGTESYLNFFNMMPEDKARVKLLAEMWHKITHETLCSEEEIQKLKDGHDEFCKRKLTDTVTVIK